MDCAERAPLFCASFFSYNGIIIYFIGWNKLEKIKKMR